MNEWENEEMAKDYEAKTSDPSINWYEDEVNFPDLMKLLPSSIRSVLDFGCGPGKYTNELSKHFDKVAGTDLNSMLLIARKKYPDIEFFEWDGVSDVSDKMGKYDAIFSKLTLQFVEDIESLAYNFRQLLGRSGILVFSIPNPHKMAQVFDLEYEKTTVYENEVVGTGIKIHPIHRPHTEYIEIFTKAGFNLEEISEPRIPIELQQKYNVEEETDEISKRMNFKFRLK